MFSTHEYHQSLLGWYKVYRRSLPWRSLSDQVPDPYKVWVSEIMLQQTTVSTVKDYYLRFLEKWPTVANLAQASLDDILHLWQGLGYYRRARQLHKCAQIIHHHYDGRFPSEEKVLLTLPGIGPYTASAIISIAFNKPSTVVDGNIERIMTRLFYLEPPLPAVKKQIYQKAQSIISYSDPADYAQALMDLGSSVCTPRKPKCHLCPIRSFCLAFQNNPESFPRRQPKLKKNIRYAVFFWIENKKGEILLEKRPETGLLPNLMGFPTSPWNLNAEPPIEGEGQMVEGVIKHTFTHFYLIGKVIKPKKTPNMPGIWVNPKNFKKYALPTLMKKVAHLVLHKKPQ